jgi:hypothetical protein
VNGVSVRIAGGLGNQMFQYAAARALALRHGVPLELDLSFYDPGRHRSYELDAFALGPHSVVAPPPPGVFPRTRAALARAWRQWRNSRAPRLAVYREPHFHFDPRFAQLVPPVRLVGHFQSARYFEGCEATIRQEFAPPPATDALSRQIAQRMGSHGVALHLRRGDYVTNPKNAVLFAVCGVDYYTRALALLPAGAEVFVFSDDMAWAREHLPGLPGQRPLVFVDDGSRRSGLADLWLMAQARHHVIANSSLSWWGAWLAAPASGLKIAPARWFVDPAMDDRDLVPAAWTRL